MKLKSILSFLTVTTALSISYFTLTSNSGGIMGVSQTGCGSCHGAQNNATTLSVTGIPATGFVAGTLYNMTLTISNAAMQEGGFDMSVTAGTMSNAPANTMLMGGTELHHTAPKAMTGGSVSWNFDWTAPASGNSVTFRVSGNAVNGNNGDSGDQWNKQDFTFAKATPTNVANVNQTNLNVYPNPTMGNINLNTTSAVDLHSFFVCSMNGAVTKIKVNQLDKNLYTLSTEHLAKGNYILMFTENGKSVRTTISKY